MNRVPDLRGQHLRLRELRADDHEPFSRILTHPVLTRYLGIDRMDGDQARDAFARSLAQPHTHPRRKYTLAVCAPDGDALLGTMGLLVEDYGSNAMLTSLVLLRAAAVGQVMSYGPPRRSDPRRGLGRTLPPAEAGRGRGWRRRRTAALVHTY
ncbi:GNAT family N-acetyltransferase [Streptomyces sp. NPDC058623]|uniref:GNAT family N-acetyltransferase n=1 Tax=Streptomyces sp. NPDC058623 TaxID=3346563 RepID=UPI003666E1DE